jgi:alanine transaminase
VSLQRLSWVCSSLGKRAKLLVDGLNALPGITCNPSDGAMYAFPQVHLSAKAIAAAKARGVEPDFLYCEELLDETGICTVPGSGFGQEEGTYHFRTTFLPQEDAMAKVISKLSTRTTRVNIREIPDRLLVIPELMGKFQVEFNAKYA